MCLHQHVLAVFVFITFVASASLVPPALFSDIAQKFSSCKTEQIPCDNGCNVDEALCRFTTNL